MANEINNTKQYHAPRFTEEQNEAWKKAKLLLKSGKAEFRALHVAMSELRLEAGKKHKGPIETLPKSEEKLKVYKTNIINTRLLEKVAEWKEYLNNPGSRKLYIIVSNELSNAQQAVQAAHCAAQFVKEHPCAPWVNGTLILLVLDKTNYTYKNYTGRLGTKNDQDILEKFCKDVFWYSMFTTYWREPDLDNNITAVALLSEFNNNRIGKQKGVVLL